MGRTSGSKDVTSDEVEKIKCLYKAGMRVLDLAAEAAPRSPHSWAWDRARSARSSPHIQR